MAGNTVTLEFAGDAEKLKKAAKESDKALDDVGKSAGDSAGEMEKTGKSSGDLLDKFSKLGNAVGGAGDAIDSASGLLDDYNQIANQSYEKTQAQNRALNDVAQTQADVNQAVIDGKQAQADYNQTLRDARQATLDVKQAGIDKEQADLDAAAAQKTYNDAVKEHGRNSMDARQALIDLHQAQQDQTQAVEDGKQAQQDAKQATIDGTQAQQDGKQASIDAKGAQLDLNDAQRAAHPPDVAKWSQDLQTYTPLLSGLVGVTGIITAAQWAWNAAQLASPTTWIVLAVIALVAIIVIIATKTHWFQDLWKKAWGGIKTAASDVWDFLKKIPGWLGTAFSKIGHAIMAPFKWAFNKVADAWNGTIGNLSWSVPGWVPFIGGNTISVPKLPHFHTGIDSVPGAPGSEMLAVLQAGEQVIPAGGGGGGGMTHVVVQIDRDTLLDVIAKGTRRGGLRVA